MLFINKPVKKLSNKEKFNYVYDEYYKYVYKIAYNVLKDDKHMEDMVQEIFMKVWKCIDIINLENTEKTKGLIGTIARNTAINKYNQLKKINKQITEVDHDTLFATTGDTSTDPSVVVTEKDSEDYIYNQIDMLGDKYKDVLKLKFKYDYTPEEIALILDINIKTVYTKLSRGRELLKERLMENERRSNNEKSAAK